MITKKDMIKTIQDAEREAWHDLKRITKRYGEECDYTSRARKGWSTINGVLEACEIKSTRWEA